MENRVNDTIRECRKLLNLAYNPFSAAAEKLVERLNKETFGDDEAPNAKASRLLLCYLEHPMETDMVLEVLTGWNMHSILVLSGLAEDTEGVIV